MNKMRVYRAANNFASIFSKGFGVIAEVNDLSGTDKSEVQWIEEEEEPFVLIIVER